ncbi:MAG: N-acetylglucosamine-6-phosphate deacetylase [Ruminococcaceae bacterium]|nr:N-acetylglucosamine-6-phosphate deacetylase [Oscillospiraceae bacterium]
MKYRISGGMPITEKGIEKKDLLIKDGRIEALIDPSVPVSPEYKALDAAGCYVSAGFVDIHQHGGGGSDYMDCAPDTYLSATEAHLRHGTTSVMPTLLSAGSDALLGAIKSYVAAVQDKRIRTNLIGLHIEGPYISAEQAGAQKKENIRVYDETEYKAIVKAGEGYIKRWSVAPEVEGAERFAAFAREQGIALSIAHSNADLETVQRAYDWGFHHVTHLYSGMSSITRRGGFRVPGVLEAAYYLDDMNVEIIADGCHLPLSLLAYVAKFKDHSRIALITDAMRAAGQDVAQSFLGSAEDPLPVIVEDGVAKMEDRTAFAGSVATADRLVRNMVKSGVPLSEAVRMMTVNPIKMMGLDLKKGELKPGYDADICVFDADISIKAVLCGGKMI